MSVISDAPAIAAAEPAALSQRLYRAIWRWHFFAGLIAVPFMISLAITGGLYLFNDEIDASLDGTAAATRLGEAGYGQKTRVSADDVLARLRTPLPTQNLHP